MHYTVMVIGADPEEQLAPFNENTEVEEYCTGVLEEEDKQEMLDYYNNEAHAIIYTDFDECYAEKGEDWDYGHCRKNEEGVWCRYSTHNSLSKWDWYLLGGRWSGRVLKLKENADSGVMGEASWCSSTHGYDAALKKDIDFEAMYREDDEWSTYAVLYNGKWIERDDEKHYGIVSDKEWSDEVKKIVESLPDDTLISIYDIHI